MPALSAVLLIFSFNSVCFSSIYRSTQYETSDVAENLDRYLSCTQRTAKWKDFELILTVNMKNRHPVEGSPGSEFPAICNHCGAIYEVAKPGNFVSNFCVF